MKYFFIISSGARTYITMRYQFKKGIDLWIRWGNWMDNNRNNIGSELNEIDGSSNTDIRAQLRFQF